jgi:molybdenum cofactor biosynthesis enzyme MoaA
MNMLENIGFYTLSDYRVKQVSVDSPLWRCELILTHRCNFKCTYCRGLLSEQKGDLTYHEAKHVLDLWIQEGLKNVRFSGGEPTLWNGLIDLVGYAKKNGVERIALSTNGSADIQFYEDLWHAGVNDFSISLDSCCASFTEKITGVKGIQEKLESNIRAISKFSYTTVGVVLTDENMGHLESTIKYAHDLGVADIRIITAAQWNKKADNMDKLDSEILSKHPILNYRISNIKKGRPMRGIMKSDYGKCPLVIDDIAIVGNKHYPCIIYLREHGKPIGDVSENMRKERVNWFMHHDCYRDEICKNNCLDVCVDYNNRFRDIK